MHCVSAVRACNFSETKHDGLQLYLHSFPRKNLLLIIELKIHAVVDLVVGQRNVVFENGVPAHDNHQELRGKMLRKRLKESPNNYAVPLLQDDFVRLGAALGC